MRASILLVLFIISSSVAGKVILQGQIVAQDSNEKLTFANVSVFSNDTLYEASATTNADGKFILNVSESDYVKVRISYIGYKTEEITKQIIKDTDLGVVRLEPEAVKLAETVVVSKLPNIEHFVDKTVVNVANSVAADGSSALDMLRKSPGVSVSNDGNVQINGKAVSIWIDGRPLHLSGNELEAYLSSMDGASLNKIELIEHPSSKYDAEGSGGIINLKTKRNALNGFNGSVKASYGGQCFGNKYYQAPRGSINLNYRSPINNTFFTYAPRYVTDFYQNETILYNDAQHGWKQNTTTQNDKKRMGHSFKVGTDFFIDSINTLGFFVDAQLRSEVGHVSPWVSTSETYQNDTLQMYSNTSIDAISKADNVSANLNYTHIFDEKKNSELTFNADYIYRNSMDSSYKETHFADGYKIMMIKTPNIFSSLLKQRIDVLSFKADFQHTFIEKMQFESGLKTALTRTSNNLMRKDLNIETWTLNKDQSGEFVYMEQIYALYASLSAQINKQWNVKGGLRGEYTRTDGIWLTQENTSKRKYFDLFPTVFVSYTPNEKYTFSTSYTLRINRPSFWRMKPFREYLDENTAVEGNPDLLPQKTHDISVSAGFIQFLNISAFYNHIQNMPSQVLYFDGSDKIYQWKNFGTEDFIGLNFSCSEAPLIKNRLTFTASVSGSYVESQTIDKDYKNKSFISNFYGNLTCILPQDWKMEVEGWGFTGGHFGYFKVFGTGSLSFGVKKGFLKNNLSCSLYFDNILNTNNQKIKYIQNGISYDMKQYYDSPSFRLSLSYRFGNAQKPTNRKVGNIEESSRLSGNGGLGK